MRCFDIDKFCSDLSNSELLTSTPVDLLRVGVHCYNSTLRTLIYLHAPIVYKTVSLRSHAPWFIEEIPSQIRKVIIVIIIISIIVIIIIINDVFLVFYLPTLNLLSLLPCT